MAERRENFEWMRRERPVAGLLRARFPNADPAAVIAEAHKIDAAMRDYARSLYGIKIRRKRRVAEFEHVPSASLTRALAKLKVAASSGSTWKWAKAWQEAPRAAIELIEYIATDLARLYATAPRVRDVNGLLTIPASETIAPLLSQAIALAGRSGRPPATPHDTAALAVMRAYQNLTDDDVREPDRDYREGYRIAVWIALLDEIGHMYSVEFKARSSGSVARRLVQMIADEKTA